MRIRAARFVLLLARGAAVFLAIFTLIGLVGELRGRASDLSLWWVDIRDLPDVVRLPLLAAFAVVYRSLACTYPPPGSLRVWSSCRPHLPVSIV